LPAPRLSLLSPEEIHSIHDASLEVLSHVGIQVHNHTLMQRLAEGGARVDPARSLVYLEEDLVMDAIHQAGKQFVLHGRDPAKTARFGFGERNLISSPGQFSWFDHRSGARREPVLADAREAAILGDALPNLTIVGAMAVPVDVPPAIRDVVLTAELLKRTGKPVRAFPISRRSSHYVLELLALVAGGTEALRQRPMSEMMLEPISPLQLPDTQVDIMLEFLEYGQPVNVSPMAMATGTAPATLAGVLVQENAEILASIVAVQALAPGASVLYGGIPHIMDPRTSLCSFGSPEQGLMALGLAELGKHYGFPVYVNVNLTDAKRLDVQAGMEKIGSLLQGMLAGADLFGHAGIVGADHGGSLAWLLADNEALGFAKRIARGFDVSEESLAVPVVSAVGPGGNYLAEMHTRQHFRQELWLPGSMWTRETYDAWSASGGLSMEQRLSLSVDNLLKSHVPEPLDPALEQEIDRLVAASRRELVD
jgi:trimethylamine---corrinoid protein Co-methyltransferase